MALKRKTDKMVSSSIQDNVGTEEIQSQSVLEDEIKGNVEWNDGKLHFFLSHVADKPSSGSSIRINGHLIFLKLEYGRVALDLPQGISHGQLIKVMENAKFIHEPYNTTETPVIKATEPVIDYWVIAHTDNTSDGGWSGIVEIDETTSIKFENGLASVSSEVVKDALLAKGFLEHSIQYKKV